jgi:alpha/beta superfamily hydrolase
MTTTFTPSLTGTIPTAKAPRCVSLSDPDGWLEGLVNAGASTAQLPQVAATAAKQLILLPRADHFFPGQLEPLQSALACWLKEQPQ